MRRQPDEEFRTYYARALGLAEDQATGLTRRLGAGACLGLVRGESAGLANATRRVRHLPPWASEQAIK
eukprot:11253673-Alexandrium_andersonii.AAC.1